MCTVILCIIQSMYVGSKTVNKPGGVRPEKPWAAFAPRVGGGQRGKEERRGKARLTSVHSSFLS